MDVITFGESMVLFSPTCNGPLRFVDTFTKGLAGAESNVAIALSRLGRSVGWFSRIGDDEFGRFIINTIRGEGIDVSRVVVDGTNPTGILFKERFLKSNPNVYYYRSNSAASFLSENDIDENYIKEARILHITGITLDISKSAREAAFKAMRIAKENGVLVSFDPNIRLKLCKKEEAVPVIKEALTLCDIVFPGIDEGKIIFKKDNERDIAEEILNLGAKVAAVKLGEKGCYIKSRYEESYVEGFRIDRIEDTVGAGDGFAAGFLHGYLNNLLLSECGRIANAVGAMAIAVKGDMEGFPTLRQLDEFMKCSLIDR
ncbi:sugar kinase [Caloramator sp. E03]|uniref:sugar kinase n=1 Tax=Caloramator sp. E03 TaxID=2576307 RepID=UPI0011109BEB|nr:sugar kinase [Caloramator sp. E03]QCX32888.1 sugar kinase [Caloramator sp. E03]